MTPIGKFVLYFVVVAAINAVLIHKTNKDRGLDDTVKTRVTMTSSIISTIGLVSFYFLAMS